ncbi:hypothetical protein JXJ21_24555, partial [candidate division KSB1 bacterium]|nr:hypothetical protein [candidate division KSB1 bacterium]
MHDCQIKGKSQMIRIFRSIMPVVLCLMFWGRIDARIPEAAVKTNSGVPMLTINGKPYPPFAWMSYLGETTYYREAAAAGIHLFCFPAYLGDRGINTRSGIGPFRPALWCGESEFDFTSLVTDFEKILAA